MYEKTKKISFKYPLHLFSIFVERRFFLNIEAQFEEDAVYDDDKNFQRR